MWFILNLEQKPKPSVMRFRDLAAHIRADVLGVIDEVDGAAPAAAGEDTQAVVEEQLQAVVEAITPEQWK